MAFEYRKPGVYVEESLLVATTDSASASSTAFFTGIAATGPTNTPVRCNTWSDYVLNFGGFDNIPHPTSPATSIRSYLPYAVYSYFQNGGRPAYIQRAIGSDEGTHAVLDINSGTVVARNITNKHLVAETNVVTLTTSAAHGFSVGQTITIDGLGAPFDGVQLLRTGSAGSTLKYIVEGENEDVPSTALTGGTFTATSSLVRSFTVEARTVGSAGENISVMVTETDSTNHVFNLFVYKDGAEVERFQFMTLSSDLPGTRRLASTVNDPYSGSTLIRVTNVSTSNHPNPTGSNPIALVSGTDPGIPSSTDIGSSAVEGVSKVEGPLLLNLVGYMTIAGGTETYTAPTPLASSNFIDRNDVFIINDNVPPRDYGESATQYKQTLTSLSQNTGDSYIASYAPWIIIADPRRAGTTITVPPGGAVAGVISRVDSTIGVFRAPAGVLAAITNAVGVDTKFSDSELGELNSSNINIIRPIPGVGVAIMGARTRKLYGADRYVSARRTLIYLKESLRRSTAFALFENNDQRLWSQLNMSAERILRPLWEAGGLRGANASEAYFIRCDASINTPAVIASGEVRMEVGVALEYPAEFIVVKITQYESGGFSAEVQPRG